MTMPLFYNEMEGEEILRQGARETEPSRRIKGKLLKISKFDRKRAITDKKKEVPLSH